MLKKETLHGIYLTPTLITKFATWMPHIEVLNNKEYCKYISKIDAFGKYKYNTLCFDLTAFKKLHELHISMREITLVKFEHVFLRLVDYSMDEYKDDKATKSYMLLQEAKKKERYVTTTSAMITDKCLYDKKDTSLMTIKCSKALEKLVMFDYDSDYTIDQLVYGELKALPIKSQQVDSDEESEYDDNDDNSSDDFYYYT